MDAYQSVVTNAREFDGNRQTIVWDVDGPISIGEDSSMPWIQLLHHSSHEDDPDAKLAFINISELETVKALRDACNRFIKAKKKKAKKK